jgi:hypothetical protein
MKVTSQSMQREKGKPYESARAVIDLSVKNKIER